jgi:uncharacterized SAM-binding protein YcdF (DUF218 family)
MLLWPVKLALKIVGVVAAIVLVYVAVTFVQVWETSHANDPHDANAALVFGTAADYTKPAPDLEARLDRALGLWRGGLVPLIAVTGGKLPGDEYTEAQISAMWLEQNHVPSGDIVQGGGDDSWQNVADVAPTLRADGVRSVLVVTDPFHEDRAMAIASSFGFAPSPTPSLHSPIHGLTELGYLLKESVEVAVGRIVGYGTLSSLDNL